MSSYIISYEEAVRAIGNAVRFANLLRQILRQDPRGGIVAQFPEGAELHVYPQAGAKRYTISGNGAESVMRRIRRNPR